jgi:hypothetical protein
VGAGTAIKGTGTVKPPGGTAPGKGSKGGTAPKSGGGNDLGY